MDQIYADEHETTFVLDIDALREQSNVGETLAREVAAALPGWTVIYHNAFLSKTSLSSSDRRAFEYEVSP